MLWSLVKIVVFVTLIAGLTLAAGLLMETGPGIVMTVGQTEFSFGPLQAVILALVAVVLVWGLVLVFGLLIALIRFVTGDETALSRYFDRNRERRGFEALADGMMALASGEGRLALAKATKAERNLARPELTNLIAAQAAEMAGDRTKAADAYKRLLSDNRTRFVGVRGLMKQHLAAGDTGTALKLAETAFALKPRHAETQDVLIRLQAESGDWKGARRTLEAKQRQGDLPRDVYKRRDAVMALQEARDLVSDDSSIETREAAIAANRASPDLIPAAVMAAQSYVVQKKPKYATRILKKAWEAQPHPDLAAAFAAIAPDESLKARIKRFQDLVKLKPDHPETRMLMAELRIADEDFPQARRALGDLAETAPTARSMTIMAAIERGEGAEDQVVRGWLTRALSAPRGPQWVCDNCHTVHAAWQPICANCAGFDTLSWTDLPGGNASAATPSDLLPLLVRPPEPVPLSDPRPSDTVDATGSATETVIDVGGPQDGPELPHPPRADWAGTTADHRSR